VTPRSEVPPPAEPLVPPTPPAEEPAPEPVQVAAVVPTPAPAPAPAMEEPAPKVEARVEAKPKLAPPPPVPRPPDVYVARTEWHPIAERRIAVVELGTSGEAVVREGDVIGSLVVAEIEPTGVHFMHDGLDVRRRVGER